jgi:dihydroflavonol-4-reductase
MKVLVTGATGFIGANLVRRLVERGDEVTCLIRKPNLCLEGLDVRLLTAPLGDRPEEIAALRLAIRGCEGLYHVAGLFDSSPGGLARMRQVHIYGTRGLLRAAEREGVRRAVICSSSVTVGIGTRAAPGDEETLLNPDVIYGRSGALRDYYNTKIQEEELALGWSDLEVVVVNPDYIIGPWDVKPTSGQMILTMAKHWVPLYPRGGKCFQHVRDCADGHILAMDRGTPGRRYLLGNENLSYQEFMGLVASVVGQRPPVLPMSRSVIQLAGVAGRVGRNINPHRFVGLDTQVLQSMQQERYRSGLRAREELGVPATPVRTAIEEAYTWFREHGYC